MYENLMCCGAQVRQCVSPGVPLGVQRARQGLSRLIRQQVNPSVIKQLNI